MEKIITQISKELYKIEVPLPHNPLRATNSYLIRGREQDLLIDSGFDLPECRETLAWALNELQAPPERRAVLGTHVHSDHIGILDSFRGTGQPFYMSQADTEYNRNVVESGEFYHFQESRFIKEGFPPDEYEEASWQKRNRNKGPLRLPDDITMLTQGECIDLGGIQLQLLLCPGHTPGNSMFYVEKEEILFTGDHILFDISPNITAWPHVTDSLNSYLQSLQTYQELPVRLALPGHRSPGNYQERTRALICHHQKRLAEAIDIIRSNPGITAYDLTGLMKWNIRSAHGWDDFPVQQKYYAVGECLSHCDYLVHHSLIRREMANGVYVYYTI